MQVCIDLQAAIAQRAGVGRYVHTLVQHLIPLAGDDHLRGFYFDFHRRGSPFTGLRETACRFPGAVAQQAWKRLSFPPYPWFAGPADLYHFPNYVLPPLPRRARAVVNVHDAGFIKVPETLEPRNLAYLTRKMAHTLKRADLILTISQTVTQELIDLFHLPPERVEPVLLAMPPEFERPDDAAILRSKTALGLDRPYLLHVGTIEPRKNHRFLLEVFERMDGFDGKLVLSGMPGWKSEPFLERLAASPRRRDVVLANFVADEHLPGLYAGAEAFLFPSLYEGFGLPPLEAMRCGCPVVTSAGGSLREVVEPGGLVLEAFDAELWAHTVQNLVTDRTLRAARIQAGLQHAATFSWERTARETWEVYRSFAP